MDSHSNPAGAGPLDGPVRPGAEASDYAEWQSVVFTLMGHAGGLYANGEHDMPVWFFRLAEKIARAHLDEYHAQRVREVAVQYEAQHGIEA